MVNLSEKHQNILDALIHKEKQGGLDRATFENIPIEVYHHPLCPGVSSTRLKAIIERNYNYAEQFKFESTVHTEFGLKFHKYIESPTDFAREISVGKFEPGKMFCSFEDFTRLGVMLKNVKAHPEAAALLEHEESKQEWTFFARCPFSGVLRKVRPDIFSPEIIGDWKTCQDASKKAFQESCKRYLYRVSARYYMDVIEAATGRQFKEFKFVAVESVGLHNVAVYPVAQKSLDAAKDQIDVALSAIANARSGGWTGYPLNQEPIFI